MVNLAMALFARLFGQPILVNSTKLVTFTVKKAPNVRRFFDGKIATTNTNHQKDHCLEDWHDEVVRHQPQ